MIKKQFDHNIRKAKKEAKKVADKLPDSVSDKAAVVLNPLAPPTPEDPVRLEDIPQITDKTITKHREEVLSGARKYIYPLQHSKHRIVSITLSIIGVAAVAFLIYCTAALYRFYQYNTFLYRVSQVVPFPVAHSKGTYIAYENYLFELRHYVHYYQNQSQADTSSTTDKQQLVAARRQALSNVINYAYIKKLADANHVSVSNTEVDARINEVRAQNRLGSDNKVFNDVLRDYWGWSINDFKRSLKQEILSEKVNAKLDTATTARANSALAQLTSGTDFGALARIGSDDPTAKDNGGDYGFGVTKTNPNVPPEVVDALFKLKPGQVSGVILASPLSANSPPSLQIVKVLTNDGTTVTAQHMVFNLKDIQTYVKPLEAKEPTKTYVHF